jgi:hypothetical protein
MPRHARGRAERCWDRMSWRFEPSLGRWGALPTLACGLAALPMHHLHWNGVSLPPPGLGCADEAGMLRLQQGFATNEMGSGVSLHGTNPKPLTSALGHKRTFR